jgi:propionyl-CoA carboxylase alpha chain
MREALNGFVIRGISSNIPFQAALLAHPKFVAGDFNTGFIAEHYGQGFHAEDVPHDDPFPGRAGRLHAPPLPRARLGHQRAARRPRREGGRAVRGGRRSMPKGEHVHTPVSVTDFQGKTGSSAVQVGEQELQDRQQRLRSARCGSTGTVNDKPFTAQVERGAGKNPLALRVSHNGTQIEAMVLSPLGARLLKLMPYKAPPDLSKFLMSPMPGLLVEVSVQPGQQVQAGEKLAVIEAMKMENVLFATQDGVVGTISAAKGESLAVDQIIMEFN